MARPQGRDGSTYLWLLQGDRHLPDMRVGVQYHVPASPRSYLIRCAAFKTAKHRQTITTGYRWAYRWGLFHLQAAPVDVDVLERWRMHTAEHPEYLGFYAFARIDKFCRPMRGAGHTAYEMLADPSPNTKSEYTCGSSITPAQINDIGLVPYLAIGQYEELSRALRVWCHL